VKLDEITSTLATAVSIPEETPIVLEKKDEERQCLLDKSVI
jgi:hypothetical protein